MTVGTSKRLKIRDPAFCNKLTPGKCNAIQMKTCPEKCSGKVDEVQIEHEVIRGEVIPMEAVDENMMPLQLNKVSRSDLYRQAWPVHCNGKNVDGNPIVNLNTDRFHCSKETGTVNEITHPAWRMRDRYYSCCKGVCSSSQACGHVTYTFAEAARAALARYALRATHVKTQGGKQVQVNVEQSEEEDIKADGVLAKVEVRMFESELKFKVASPVLQNSSGVFFDDLVQTLGPLISMQITAFDTPVKVLLCAHSETTRTQWNSGLPQLPFDRAKVLKERLEKFVPKAVAELGDPVGHFAEEVTGYQGGRRAIIIYKIFDSSKPSPTCELNDLHPFLRKYSDA